MEREMKRPGGASTPRGPADPREGTDVPNRTPGPCQKEGCGRDARTRGYCKTHYTLRHRRGLMPPRPTTEQRYEAKVDRSGGPDACHPWTAARNKAGYGLFCHDGETLAGRWAYKHYAGPLKDGEHIRHTCDNPPCQNPRHWFLGTPADNGADKVAKGRHSWRPLFGEENPASKLEASAVSEIRSAYAAGATQATLAVQYGVSQTHIGRIARGVRRADGTPPIDGSRRRARGERHHAAKLTDDQVCELRDKYAAGDVSQTALAREYGLSQNSVSAIVRRLTRT